MTNFLEQQVEEQIRAALAAACASVSMPALGDGSGALLPLVVAGFWQPAAAGEVKQSSNTCLLVKIPPGGSGGFGSQKVTLAGSVAVKVAASDSPSGDLLTELAAPVISLLRGWCESAETMTAALSVTDVFSADGFMLDAGGDADFDTDLEVWYCTVNFQIKGRSY